MTRSYTSGGEEDNTERRRSSSNLLVRRVSSREFIALNMRTSMTPVGSWTLGLFLLSYLRFGSAQNAGVPDTKACCQSKGVSDYCMEKMCDTSRPPDEFDVFEVANVCTRYLTPIASCLSDGRNHTRCCRANAKGVDDLCMHLCDGSPYSFNSSMWEEYKGYVACLTFNVQSIFTCLDRGYSIGPGPPARLETARVTSTTARLKWASPTVLPQKVTKYSVYYAILIDQSRRYPGWSPAYQRVDTDDQSKKFYDLDRLTPDTRYRAYVVARGDGGSDDDTSSLPSEPVEFVTDGVASSIVANPRRLDAPIGLPTTLICFVNTRGGGARESIQVNWYYGRNQRDFDSTPLSSNRDKKYQTNLRLMPQTPNSASSNVVGRTYVASLVFDRVATSDLGLYRCSARTPFGDSATTVELTQAAPIRAPQSPPNVTECCASQGVQAKCIGSCQNNIEEQSPLSLFQGSAHCGQDFPKILRCAVGSAVDQQQQQRERGFCCLRRGVPSSCLFLCDSDRPMAPSQDALFACIQYTNELLQCLIESKQYLPSPPTDLRVRAGTSDPLILEWSPPSTDQQDITAYHIYYKRLNEQSWRKISTPATASTVAISDLSPRNGGQYVAVAIASNTAGISDASRPIQFAATQSANSRLRDQSMSRRRKSRNNARHNVNNNHHHHHHRPNNNHGLMSDQQE